MSNKYDQNAPLVDMWNMLGFPCQNNHSIVSLLTPGVDLIVVNALRIVVWLLMVLRHKYIIGYLDGWLTFPLHEHIKKCTYFI